LALLYNAPRAATIIAKTDSILFSLDRECFNHIVKDAAAKKRQKYENLLESIELLDAMDNYERSQIADALLTRTYEDGEYVVTQVYLSGRERHHLLLRGGGRGHRSQAVR
jgi:cAMP-dependent protein kinase regulator